MNSTAFTAEELKNNWTAVAYFDEGELVAYRSKIGNGLLRIIDIDSGCDILEAFGNPFTTSNEDAKSKAEKIMAA